MSRYYPVYGERLMGYAIFEAVETKALAETIAREKALLEEGDMIITIPRALTKEELLKEFGPGVIKMVEKAEARQLKTGF